MKKFAHYGSYTLEKKEGMFYIESIHVWATNPDDDPNKMEYVFIEPDSPLANTPVATGGHIAYLVTDLEKEVADKDCFFAPMEVCPGVRVAFFTDESGVVTEYCQLG